MKKSLGIVLATLAFAGVAAWPLPQGQGKKDQKQQDNKGDTNKDQSKDSDKSKDSKSDQPLFSGTIDAKGSQKSADTATLGFKGVGPDGQIDPAKLAENPTGEDEMLVTQIQQIAVAGDDLKEFIKDGNLKGR